MPWSRWIPRLVADVERAKFEVALRERAGLCCEDCAERLCVKLVAAADFPTDYGHFKRKDRFVPNWPATPPGETWFELTTNQPVPSDWVGRWGLFPWDTKVYILRQPAKGAG